MTLVRKRNLSVRIVRKIESKIAFDHLGAS
jgi:hypothetical protein